MKRHEELLIGMNFVLVDGEVSTPLLCVKDNVIVGIGDVGSKAWMG